MSEATAATAARGRAADFLTLTKPGITSMVAVTAGLGYWLALDGPADAGRLLQTMAATAFASAGAGALNMAAEWRGDARMRRTESRPIPAGRIRPGEALVFGVLLAAGGAAWLAAAVHPACGALAAAIVLGYVFVYTPLKPVTTFSALAGAPLGAAPPLIGWLAARGGLDAGAWALFAIQFAWQLPHVLAMAWMNREDYIRVRYPMAPVYEASGRAAAVQMIVLSAALAAASLVPAWLGMAGAAYAAGAGALGAGFLACAIAFAANRTVRRARVVFLASLVYLPLLLGLLAAFRSEAGHA